MNDLIMTAPCKIMATMAAPCKISGSAYNKQLLKVLEVIYLSQYRTKSK